jgi:hypothetical protein
MEFHHTNADTETPPAPNRHRSWPELIAAAEAAHPRFPARRGVRPATTNVNPHEQLDQWGPPDLRDRLAELSLTWPGTSQHPSNISVPGAIGIWLDQAYSGGPDNAFQRRPEFAHIHPDGSLHLSLPIDDAQDVIAARWGELHPIVSTGWLPPNVLMVYAPRDDHELQIVSSILEIAYQYASQPAPSGHSGRGT